jgi:hypothetical protein
MTGSLRKIVVLKFKLISLKAEDLLSAILSRPPRIDGKEENPMIRPRYIVFDDAPHERRLGCTADQFADALRSPLALVGVRVVRRSGAGSALPGAGFQIRGWSRSQYDAKRETVAHVVGGVMEGLADAQQPRVMGEPLVSEVKSAALGEPVDSSHN